MTGLKPSPPQGWHEIDIEVAALLCRNPGSFSFFGHDITGRKKAEEEFTIWRFMTR